VALVGVAPGELRPRVGRPEQEESLAEELAGGTLQRERSEGQQHVAQERRDKRL
jgi:hypothetical protein